MGLQGVQGPRRPQEGSLRRGPDGDRDRRGTQPVAPLYELDYLHVISGTGVVPSATVRLKKEGQTFQDSGVGDGPIDAVLRRIEAITA